MSKVKTKLSPTFEDLTDQSKKVDLDISGATTATTTTLVASQTANRTITLPNKTGTLATTNGETFNGNVQINGTLGVTGATTLAAASSTDLTVGNIEISGNDIFATDTNGTLHISPQGTGSVNLNLRAFTPSLTANNLITTISTNLSNTSVNGTLAVTGATTLATSLTGVAHLSSGVVSASVVTVGEGGTGQTTKAAGFDALSPLTTGGDILYGGTSGTGTRLANGSAGQVLTSAGGTSAPTWASIPAAATKSYQLNNLGIAASISSNALTVSLTDSTGAAPSAGSPVSIGFRADSGTSGNYQIISVTGATSVTAPAGATLGIVSGVPTYVYVYACEAVGTGVVNLGLSPTVFDEGSRITPSTIGAGSTTVNTLYSASGGTSVIRIIGRLLVNEATSGTWASNPTEISVVPFIKTPMIIAGDIIYGGTSGVPTRLAAGTAGQILTSAGAAAPVWSTRANLQSTNSSAQTLNTGTQYALDFATTNWNVGTGLTISNAGVGPKSIFSQGWKATVNTAGKYLVSAQIQIVNPSMTVGQFVELGVMVNGSVVQYYYYYAQGSVSTFSPVAAITTQVNCAVNDTIQIEARQNGAAGYNYGADATTNRVNIVYQGP